jgi:hypothetical protein
MEYSDLYPIIEYKMNNQEAKAYRLALIYQELAREYFPKERCGKIPKKGDPRKCNLFRHCYKLLEERQGQLLDDQYRLYIRAQFDILKNIKNEKQHADVSPNCIVGPKSWRRWQVWLRKFRSYTAVQASVVANAPEAKVVEKLKRTKKFLETTFKRLPNYDDIEDAFRNRAMIRWITLGKVCGYYVLMSPLIEKYMEGNSFEDVFEFDLSIYKPHLTDGLYEFFKKEFAHEFLE